MMRQAQQRKETDIDFEEKKMNLSLGEDDIYKENVLNTRPASPLFSRSDHEDEENFPDRCAWQLMFMYSSILINFIILEQDEL